MTEIWKDIEGYEGFYAISNTGKIKSFYKKGFNRKFKIDKDGYFHVGLTKSSITKTFRVHRLVARAFIDNPNNLQEVNHKDLNKQNNNSDNLEWIDSRSNKRHYHKDENENTGVFKIGGFRG